MNRVLKVIFFVLAVIDSSNTVAGEGSGRITQLLVHDTGDDNGMLMFITESHAGKPACAAGSWAVSLGNEAGRGMYQLLLMAQAQSKSIHVSGYGDCNDWSDRERPRYVLLVN